MVPIDLIDPNPNQPRQVMGDLSELMASIAEKGIIEPLVLRQRGERYQIIAGERRYQAAVQVGLKELPGVIREGDDNEVLEVALVENLQRKDLTPFEEAEAMAALAQRCAYTHEMLAKKLGKSRVAVTESLALQGMPDEVKNLCRLADITSKSLLLQIVRQGDPQKMAALDRARSPARAAPPAKSSEKRPPKPSQAVRRPSPSTTGPRTRPSTCKLSFAKGKAEREDVIAALEAILRRPARGRASTAVERRPQARRLQACGSGRQTASDSGSGQNAGRRLALRAALRRGPRWTAQACVDVQAQTPTRESEPDTVSALRTASSMQTQLREPGRTRRVR